MKCADMGNVKLLEVRLESDLTLQQDDLGLELGNLRIGGDVRRFGRGARERVGGE